MTIPAAAGGGSGHGLVEIDGEQFYRIDDVGRLDPFLMSVVSDGDRWMFVSSSGALTAGRRDADSALFPYVTDDRLHAAGGASGPVTALRVSSSDGDVLWEPFAARLDSSAVRSVSKAVTSHAVCFEERHAALGLTFSYRWGTAERFGFVRTAELRNDGSTTVTVDVIDGLVDVLPYGLEPGLYHRFSNLTHAYKRSEIVDAESGLVVYTLESPVSDQPEPAEVLRATAVWSFGLDGVLDLHPDALVAFRRREHRETARCVTGIPGAHLRRGVLELEPGESATWYVVADVALDHSAVIDLRHLVDDGDLAASLGAAIRRTGERLGSIVALADAQQVTGDPIACAHHVSNVIYNVMRGGVPLDGYRIDSSDFGDFVVERNRRIGARHESWLAELPDSIDRFDLLDRIAAVGDPHLTRLGDEYLPFSFSRRHGDPSRPWNRFTIDVAGSGDEPVLSYEGNWRDVFQNWEALCASFPEFLPGVISVFVNASTADGHNPYRISRAGIDWEVPEPDDPWANIGYWGDHQVVYLLRLLEAAESYLPGEITRRLTARVHTYADVPYRIAPYDDIVGDPKSTIEYDDVAADESAVRVADVGADGRLISGSDGDPMLVTLAEKLLVTALARLSNFVPGGGIWMNTQRPEWNDANNALVGNGVSMVTLFHLRRFLDHLCSLVEPLDDELAISVEVAIWLDEVRSCLDRPPSGSSSDDDVERRDLMDRLGVAASRFRTAIYTSGHSGVTVGVAPRSVAALCTDAIVHLDATIAASRRADGLVHGYVLVDLSSDDSASLVHLPAMLEGQVAALTPGVMSPSDQADLLDALFTSELYRPEQRSFVLTPPTLPPAFVDKNIIDPTDIDRNELLVALLAAGDRSIVVVDADGRHRFAPDLVAASELGAALDRLASAVTWRDLVDVHRSATHAVYERVFGHGGHIGRSGSMHAYEGIGSIYWHMVTKLLLAVQEAAIAAPRRGGRPETVDRLVEHYRRVRAGLGVEQTPEEFGAIPIDPYSHTPAHAGAQQPGMTGAVKEEILARRAELGVRVEHGQIVFDPLLLRASELLEEPARWNLTTDDEDARLLELAPESLGLSVCGVPVAITITDGDPSVEVDDVSGRTVRYGGDRLPVGVSAQVFRRSGVVHVVRAAIRRH